MKKILSTLLPALSLLTLGGCASTAGLSTTESDGVYYSSSDRTTQSAAAVAAATPATRDELTNPDYTDQGSSATTTDEGTEYYDDDFAYSSRIRRFHQPYYSSFGYGYNDFIYADPFWYGGPGYGYGGYDPFWGGGYGYGSAININIGFGSPWGWGRPWGWNRYGGYGRGYYDGFYNGYYGSGYGGYGGYYGGNIGYYGNGGGAVNQRYGPRSSRSAEAVTSGRTGNGTSTGVGASTGGGRGRVTEGGLVAPGGNTAGNVVGSNPAAVPGRRNVRMTDAATSGSTTGTPGIRSTRTSDLGTDGAAGQTAPDRNTGITRSPALQDAATERPTRSYEGRRWRVAQDGAGSTSQPAPDYSQSRRSNRAISTQSQSQGSTGQASEQPVRRSSPQRTYEAPQRAQRSEAPMRSYEAPSRASEPSRSYSSPSGGGGNGGGNSGGGGGRGRVN